MKFKTKFKIGDRVYNKIYDRIAEISAIFTHIYKTKSGNIKRRIYYTLIGIGEELIEQQYCFAVKDKCYQCNLPFVDCECCENFLNIKKKIETKKGNKGE